MKTLERRLGLAGVVTISISAMLGSGVFVLPGLAVSMTGGSAWLAYAAVALCVLPAALSKAELGSAIPRSGGAYVYIMQAFGPLIGTTMGLGLWASLLLKSAFALMGFGAYLEMVAPELPILMVSLVFLVFIVGMNIMGVKKVSKAQSVVVAISMITLGVLIVFAIPHADASRLSPFLPNGPMGFAETVGFVFVAYAGVTKVGAIAGEVSNPGKNLPRGILLSLLIVTGIYCLAVLVLSMVLPTESLSKDIRPIYSLAVAVGGPGVGVFVAFVAVLTMCSMSNAGLLASSRFPFAMSRDQLLPPAFGELHKDYLTPVWSIIITGMVMGVTISFLDITKIVKLASAFKVLAYLSCIISQLIIRESKAGWYRPTYWSPLYPGIQIFGIVVCLGLLFAMGMMAVYALVVISTLGVLLYGIYGRKRTTDRGVLSKMGKRGDLSPPLLDTKVQEVGSVMTEDAAAFVALIDRERSVEKLTEIGTALSGGKRVEVVHITEVPNQTALDEVLDEEPRVVSMRRRVLAMRETDQVDVKFDPIVSHDTVASLHDLSLQMHCEWLVMSYKPFRFFNPLGWLYNHLPNDLAIFKDEGIRNIRRIMVLAEPGPLDQVVAEATHHLARYYEASVTFVYFVHDNASTTEKQYVGDYLDQVQSLCETPSDVLILRGQSEVDAYVETTEHFDLFVLGARPHSSLRNVFLKTTEDILTEQSVCCALLLKSPRVGPKAKPEPLPPFVFMDHISAPGIVLHSEVQEKLNLFESLAKRCGELVEEADTGKVLLGLSEREAAGNTGVGHGVAMPHATVPGLLHTHLFIEVLKEPMAYNAHDGAPIDIVFCTIGPAEHRHNHLLLISTISRLILETTLLTQLREAKNSAEVMSLFKRSLV
ncbi:MAG: amino acid permease [Deltaproteobacteria bacterium]|nr:amino acid permease [Deltaproteobacteria bacterium]